MAARATTTSRTLVLLVVALVAVVSASALATRVGADVVRAHNDAGATGWYPDQPVLSSVVVHGGTFGQLFAARVDGQVYAQPLVHNGTLLVATENDKVYGLDPVTGTHRWKRDLGVPWKAADLGCADLTPNVGVTGTPVVDAATHTEYLVAKTYAQDSSGVAKYAMHALDVATGAERPGFPVTITGAAQNAPHVVFNATYHLQRPGLLLMDGVVYAAFGGHCDHPPYSGWVAGISTAGQRKTMWTTQPSGEWGAGIWQSGGALLSDAPHRILLATGNGNLQLTGPTAGNHPPGDLSEVVAHLTVQPDGTLRTDDFFTPYDAPALDDRDADFGSGGPVALPTSYNGTPLFGTPSHPRLMLAEGKAGYVYLLDPDHLGGYRAGPNGGDNAVARIGPYGGVWSTPAVWPGQGGYVYIVHGRGAAGDFYTSYLRAYRYGVDGAGKPTLALAGHTPDAFGFGSGAPVVTSDGLTPGSALLWAVWQADGTGAGAQLRAYDAVPVNGELHLRWSAPIGTAVKFAPPAVSGNRVYVGARDGFVRGFGSPVDQVLVPSPGTLFFPDTVVHHTSARSVRFTATRAVTVTGLASSDAEFATGTPSRPLPASLAPGDALDVPVSFTPAIRALVSGTMSVAIAGRPSVAVGMEGVGRLVGGDLAVFPNQLSLGGAAIGGSPISGTVTFSNSGASPLHVTRVTVPPAASHLSVAGLPAVGATIAAGGAVIATVTFRPTAAGFFDGTVELQTDAAPPGRRVVDVGVSANAAPRAHLVVSQTTAYFGTVRVGTTAQHSIQVVNTGGTAMTITKSKPPSLGNGFTPVLPVDEGTTLGPGDSATFLVAFRATRPGHFVDTWVVNGDDDTGLHALTFDAYAGSEGSAAYWLLDVAGRVYPLGDAVGFGNVPLSGATATAIVPTPSGRGYLVLDDRGRVRAAGDALALGSVSSSALRSGERATTLSMTPSGHGYWVFTTAGRAFAFGDARTFGDLARTRLKGGIVASSATASGLGYYMVGSDGGVFAFGDARFYGSTGSLRLARPVVAVVPTATGKGYWLAAADGGVFSFGDARFLGSMGGRHLNAPVRGMARYGHGYVMVAADGGIFNFSDVRFVGSLGSRRLPAPIVAVGAFAP